MKASVNGIELAYEVTGTGDPVLLIGGSGMPPAAWQLSQVPALVAAGYQVITFASRGVMPSQAPPPPYTVTAMAADTAGLIDHLGLVPCRLVGASLGGFVAEELCRARPDLVRGVALISCAGRATAFVRAKFAADRELFAAGAVPYSHDLVDALVHVLPGEMLRDEDAAVEHWIAMLAHQPAFWANADGRIGQFEAAWSWMLDEDRVGSWPGVTAPCLVIAFEDDLYFPPRIGREAAGAMADATFVEIAGAAHGGLFEKGHEINDLLTDFFRAC